MHQHTIPSLGEVVAYARKKIDYYLPKFTRHLPPELKEEASQHALERVLEAYQRLDPETGAWRAFIQTQCWGGIRDYVRDGHGFEEQTKTLHQEDTSPDALRRRITVTRDDGTTLDVGEVAAIYGRHAGLSEDQDVGELFDSIEPNWDLVARLASRYEDVHLVAKVWLGCTQQELADQFGVTRERLSQRVQEFFERLDSSSEIGTPSVEQIIYAFGLSKLYHQPAVDNGVGWTWEPVNLFAKDSVCRAREALQPNLLEDSRICRKPLKSI